MMNRINSKYLRLIRKYIIDLLISKKSILNGLNFPIDGRILKKKSCMQETGSNNKKYTHNDRIWKWHSKQKKSESIE